MSLLLLVLAVFFFLLDALQPVFDYTLGDFYAHAWGSAAFAASFLVGPVNAWRSRQ